ncbi:MAG TPA: hypothetical protein DEP20_00865, partial [Fusobacteria bacterium]|nr:hypothetical protein [Fusobacteriota bacterium]
SFVSLLYEKSGRDVGFCNILFSMISFRNKKLVINSVDEELKKVFVANSDSWELVYGMVEEEKPGFLQIVQNHDKVLETYITEIENKIDILVKSVKRKALKKRLNKFRSSNPHIAVKILDMVSFTLDLIFNYKGLIDVKSDRYFKDGSDSASVALRIITVLSIFVKELSEFKIDRAINKDEIRYLNEKYSELSSEILNREVPGRATKAIKKG